MRPVTSPQNRRLGGALVIISCLGALLYLIAIPAGLITTENRFGSVEAAVFFFVLLFSSGVLSRLARLAFSEKGLEIQMEELQQRVEKDVLGFLVRNLVSKHERGHLWGLAADKAFPYTKSAQFEKELRNLRDLGLISPLKTTTTVAGLPPTGELRQFFAITAAGREYLEHWTRFGQVEQYQ